MARFIVLGAAGFIGRAVRRALRDAGDDVMCVDRTGDEQSGETWLVLDLLGTSAAELRRVIREAAPRAVINCAGLVEGTAEQLVQANVLVVARLVDVLGGEA